MQWYIVEAELAKHGTWTHIAPQVSRQIVAAENSDTKRALVAFIVSEVEKSEKLKGKFSDLGYPEIKIQGILEEIMEKPLIMAIPIDEIPVDLKDYAKTLRVDCRIIKIEKYLDEEGEVAYKFPELTELPPSVPEKEESTQKPITEAEFLAKCEEPGRIIFQKLKTLAMKKKHELTPRTQAFSYYILTKKKRFCPLIIWDTSVTIYKWNLSPENGISPDAKAAFLEEVSNIEQLPDRFESLKEPYLSTRQGDLSEDNINRFMLAFEELLESIH